MASFKISETLFGSSVRKIISAIISHFFPDFDPKGEILGTEEKAVRYHELEVHVDSDDAHAAGIEGK